VAADTSRAAGKGAFHDTPRLDLDALIKAYKKYQRRPSLHK